MLDLTNMFAAQVQDLARVVQAPKPKSRDPLAAAREAQRIKAEEMREETQDRIYRALLGNPCSTRIDLHELTGISLELLRVTLSAMQAGGRIENKGSKWRPEYVARHK